MTQLFIFTIADAREVPPEQGNMQVRTLHVLHDWHLSGYGGQMQEPETLTAMYRLVIAARAEGGIDPGPYIQHSTLIRAIALCWSLGNGIYGDRDGGPYAMVLDDQIRGLAGLESYIHRADRQKWYDAKFLARHLAGLKRYLYVGSADPFRTI